MSSDLTYAWSEMQAAHSGYKLAWSMWLTRGVDEVFSFTSDALRQKLRQSSRHYKFPVVRTAIKAMLARTELRSITTNDDAANALIEKVLTANEMQVYWGELFTYAYVCGDAYLHWANLDDIESDEDLNDDAVLDAGYEINIHSPMNVRAFYDTRNPRRKRFVAHRWSDDEGKSWSMDLWYIDRVEQWYLPPNMPADKAESWQHRLDDVDDLDSWILDPETERIPWYHYRTALPYGVPEHEAGFGAQHALTKMLISQITTTDSHTFEQRYKLVDSKVDLDHPADNVPWEDDADAPAYDRGAPEPSRSAGGPGTMLTIHNAKSVGTFPAADPAKFLTPAELYIRLMALLTETPLHNFDPGGEQPSGEARKVAESPLVNKIRSRHTGFAGTTRSWVQDLLADAGTPKLDVNVEWAPVETAVGTDDWEVIAAKQKSGVPTTETLIEAGYARDVVEKWLDNEAEAMDLTRRVTVLAAIGDAVQKLSTGVTLGALDQAQLTRIVDMVLSQTVPDEEEVIG